jgi:hypothetical protein
MSKQLPRFESVRPGSHPEQWLTPLPPVMVELLGEAPELRAHRELAGHFETAAERVAGLAVKVEKVRREDVERRRQALVSGRKRPAQKLPGLEAEHEQARDDRQIIGEALEESAVRLLSAAIEHLAAADEHLERRVGAALEEVELALRAGQDALARAEQASAEHGWVASVLRFGAAPPWRDGARAQPAPRTREALARALAMLEEDRRRAEEIAAEAERDERAARQDPPPPGTTIWRAGETLHVAEDGTVEEAR